MDFAAFQLLVLDVDGVLTDGGLIYDVGAEEHPSPEGARSADRIKVFHSLDGQAMRGWMASGCQLAVITGRDGPAVRRRLADLGVGLLQCGVADKSAAFARLIRETGVPEQHTIYVGDDTPDLGPMRACGLPVAVRNASAPVKRAARYVTRIRGGHGAVAEVIAWVQQKQRAAAGLPAGFARRGAVGPDRSVE